MDSVEYKTAARGILGMTQEVDVIDELRTGLELATDEELETLTEILFHRKFNPLDYVYTPEVIEIQSRDRLSQLDAIEDRFRFLAADGLTVLRRKTEQISYRQVLMQVCRHLKVSYSQSFSTEELEAEIFLYILNCAWEKLPADRQRVITGQLQDVLSHSQITKQLPQAVHKDPIPLVLKGGGALAMSSVVGPWLLQQITRQFALHAATYQVAGEALVRGGVTVATQIQSKLALQTASRGMAASAARYGAVRSMFAVVGPALWMWFFADLGWRSIATNYSRVIPVIFTLAQIRLTRSACFVGA